MPEPGGWKPGNRNRPAIAGVGLTEYTRDSGSTVLSLAVDACLAALEDCGLGVDDLDGLVSFSYNGDSVGTGAVAMALGAPELTYALDLNLGGQAPCLTVMQAAMAVQAGLAETIVVFRALNGRSGYRIGREVFPAPTSQYRYPIGLTAYAQGVAMWARRYMIETGCTEIDLAQVPVAQRAYAVDNPRAMRRRPMTIESHLAEAVIIDPFRAADCTVEVDGACAVVVTTMDRARDLQHRPVSIDGAAWASLSRPGHDVSDVFGASDLTRNFTGALAPRLWDAAGLGPSDVEFAQIYDCFSSTVLFGLEGLGFAGRGEAGAFIASGATGRFGALPVNTNGGMLSEGYVHGMNTVVEAVLQVQGRASDRQLRSAQVGVVTSGALTDGSALVVSDGAR